LACDGQQGDLGNELEDADEKKHLSATVKKFTHGLQGRLPFPYKKSLHRENTVRDYPWTASLLSTYCCGEYATRRTT
jgi:hypothetical protein